ncbi:hypothetical protein BD289DRAFT_422291 [Coniella lustricola]|uniref:Uncharacterized protein n=1 Tax=Coniella lustricola TaxID=2025994 RepID=A0A2T3AKR3_9PEZI|nr:hypothetical protein BD289DRAFT_422291 [Coniella lustricola]
MESSPLTKAHDHAKAALDAFQTANSTVAINEHTLAAGEFSNAARATSSIEALRTLRLLEQHHQKLSELIKFSVDHPAKQAISEKDAAGAANTAAVEGADKAVAQNGLADTSTGTASTNSGKSAAAIPSLTPQRRYPLSRELSSSIASNLASARGIRGSRSRAQPAAPSISNDLAPGNLDVAARKDGSRTRMQHMLDAKNTKLKPSWVPPAQPPSQTATNTRVDERHSSSNLDDQADDDEPMTTSSVSEEGFSRFYSTFGSIINRLSAPLAFAGLPLITEESASSPATVASSSNHPTNASSPGSPTQSQQKRGRSQPTTHATADDPDLSKIFSKAALQAVYRDVHSGNDSFFVVPTSGHTVSYANILNFDQKEKRRAMAASIHSDRDTFATAAAKSALTVSALDEQEDEDFVDARTTPTPPSPIIQNNTTKRRGGKSQTDKDLYNVIEELTMANQSLKGTLDKVTKRLHAFEASAQHSRLAMVDSMRLVPPPQAQGQPVSPSLLSQSSGGGGGSSDEALKRRMRELEEELALAGKQFEVLERDNKHLKRTIEKYREKWEALKAGAKARREASQSADT